MTKLPFKQQIADLAHLLKLNGVRHVVICPGSRNAPLIQVFERDNYFTAFSIVDERSAGYVALGMAKQITEPVVVLTSSGTAPLNLAPSVAEAYYQHLPLIILTADRPMEWPPQFSNQKINQQDIFAQNIKHSCSLPLDTADEAEFKQAFKTISNHLHSASQEKMGPVHINIPLMEPLYDQVTSQVSPFIDTLSHHTNGEINPAMDSVDEDIISAALKNDKSVLIVAGMKTYSPEEKDLLISMVSNYQTSIIAENLTNLFHNDFVSAPELVLASLDERAKQSLQPDLVITFGGQVVSKRARLFVQGLENIPILVLDRFPRTLFEQLAQKKTASQNNYCKHWKDFENEALIKGQKFLERAEYSNLVAISDILKSIPEKAHVHLGNSGTVRYSQLQAARPDLKYYSNRGTSGIDGSLSTAVGAAMLSSELHVLILGDLSFVYDSNGLWNGEFPDNLKIIVLNDKGGGIFRLLEGPDRMSFFEKFSVTSHPVSLWHISKAFGLKYHFAKDSRSLNKGLNKLFSGESDAAILEVETAECENSSIFKKFYKSIHNQ